MALNKKRQDELKLDDKEEETRWEEMRLDEMKWDKTRWDSMRLSDQMRLLYEKRKDELRQQRREGNTLGLDGTIHNEVSLDNRRGK